MADTIYTYSKATDFAGPAVEPGQFSDELVVAGHTPQKITYDHGDVVKVYIDDATAKSEIDTEATAHTPS